MEAKPAVWIIDSQQWPRASLRALLIEHGFDAIGFMDLREALASLNDPNGPNPHTIVLELHHLSPTEEELDTLTHLPIPLVGIAGAVEMGQSWVRQVKWAALIQRPCSIGQVADVIEGLLTPSMKRL